MRYAQVDAQYYCGIDLHSREMYVTILDRVGQIVFYRKMPNKFSVFNSFVKPYLSDMAVAVESSCYYYWLSDACRAAGITSCGGGRQPTVTYRCFAPSTVFSMLNPNWSNTKRAADLDYLNALDPIISQLELQIRRPARQHNRRDYQLLMSIPGVGDMLGLIILYETHDISRFATVQRYSSYCGVVKCERTSAGKRIAAKNTKIRNPDLKWAYGDIILKAQVLEPKIARLYERLKSKYGIGRAKSIIAHRFAVAAYFMLKNKQVFDTERFCQSSKYK